MNNKSATDVDRTVGVRIRALRKAMDVTQTELAQAIGVTFQQVQKYENGMNRVGASRLQDLARALEVPVSTLFGEVEGTDQSDVLALLVEPDAIDLLKAYAAISNEQFRRDVLALVCSAARIGAGPFGGKSAMASNSVAKRSSPIVGPGLQSRRSGRFGLRTSRGPRLA